MINFISIWEAFMAVKFYCMSMDDCSECPLYNKDSENDCNNPPFCWDIKEEEGGKNDPKRTT